MATHSITIGSEQVDHILIQISGVSHPNSNDFWDGNWMNAKIRVRAGAFRANTSACLRRDEFQSFLTQLRSMVASCKEQASFSSLEEWLAFDVTGNKLGHFFAKGSVIDDHTTGNKLNFRIQFATIELEKLIEDLEALMDKFPVIGKP